MNWLDYLLLGILLVSVLMSARKGFSREIIGLAAALFALVLGMWFYGLAGSYLMPWVSSPRVANLLGFLLVMFAVLILGAMLGWIVSRFLRTVGLSFFDRLLGAGFGLVRGVLVAVALLTAYMAFGPQLDSKVSPPGSVHRAMLNSRIAPYVLYTSHLFVAIAPMELKASFLQQYTQVKSLLKKNAPPSRNN